MNMDEMEAKARWARQQVPERFGPYRDPNYHWQDRHVAR